MFANASPVVLIWTAVALVGIVVNCWAAADAYLDLHALRQAVATGVEPLSAAELAARELVAWGNIRREWFRVFKQSCFLIIGVVFLVFPPDRPMSAHMTTQATVRSVALVVGLLAASVAMDVAALLDRRERHNLITYINRHLAATLPEPPS